jgi:signal transduction histidine kinase
MVGRMEHDFKNMKEFTENISHEIQTPLAVIKAKIEMLLKSGTLAESQYKAINAVYQSTSRLSKLSKTLGLISKINNQEFVNKEHILLQPFVANILFNFKELAELKAVKTTAQLDDTAHLYIDAYLLDVLLSNLLKNALSHNFSNGAINIVLKPHQITLSNTGCPLNFPPEQIFDRFRRNADKPNSLGLGLAIVRKICDMNQIDIRYYYQQDRHVFDLHF